MTMSTPADPSAAMEQAIDLFRYFAGGGSIAAARGIGPQQLEALYAMGYAYFNAGRLDDAERIVSFVVMHDHLDRRYQLGLGAVLQAQRKHEAALKPYRVAALMDLTDPLPVVRMAECLLAGQRKDEAREALEFALGQFKPIAEHEPLQRHAEALLELMNAHDGATMPSL